MDKNKLTHVYHDFTVVLNERISVIYSVCFAHMSRKIDKL